ncbi:MAG: alginate export family protein [Acidobacteriota bacterium]
MRLWLLCLLPLPVMLLDAQGTAPQPPVSKPGVTGLPWWLKAGVELRGRAEASTGIDHRPGVDDGYYLHRIRLNATVEPHRWVRFVLQVQDAQAPAFSRKPVPSAFANTLDLRQGYVELGLAEKGRWGLRFGRQELILGEERLVGAANWGNVGRTFDAARLTYRAPGVRLDWFASAVVPVVNGRFDQPRLRNGFYGFYSAFDRLPRNTVVEPYFLWKTTAVLAGDLDIYTAGARLLGKLSRGFDYNVEMAFQGGHSARDRHRAWAGHWLLGYTAPLKDRPPRFLIEYNYASGDGNPRDGRRGTFDQLYPTNHNKYGTADRIGWRNIHDFMPGVEWKPARQWTLKLDVHTFWLASRQDAFYTEAGAVFLRNPDAASNRVGSEIDLQAIAQLSERLQLGLGYGRLFAGPYLRVSGRPGAFGYPYLMWTYRF